VKILHRIGCYLARFVRIYIEYKYIHCHFLKQKIFRNSRK
jgi:hypothetical protein